MSPTHEATAEQKPAEKSRAAQTVWINHAEVASLHRWELAGRVVYNVRYRSGERDLFETAQLFVGDVPTIRYPAMPAGENSAMVSPASPQRMNEPSPSGAELIVPVSTLAAITSVVKPFWRKIRKVFMPRRSVVAANLSQLSTGGAA